MLTRSRTHAKHTYHLASRERLFAIDSAMPSMRCPPFDLDGNRSMHLQPAKEVQNQ